MRRLPFVLFLLSIAATLHGDDSLRYAPESGKTFAYTVSIEIDDATRNHKSKGQIQYKADRVNDEQVTFGVVSSLRDFGRGRTKLSISPFGKLQSIDGGSSLPYLLGDLSALMLDRLPTDGGDTWSWEDDISIHRETTHYPFGLASRFGYGRIGFGPRRTVIETDKKTTATETANYKVKSRDGDLVTVERTFTLKSEPDIDGRKVEADGKATWVFNQADGMPESLEMSRTVSLTNDNVTLRAPITVSIERISEEELAKQKEEALKRMEELKKERSRPLDDDELQSLLADIKSGNRARMHSAMIKLSKRQNPEPNEEIVAAARKAGEDKFVRMLAKRVVEVYGTADEVAAYASEAEVQELREKYRTGFGKVDSTGRRVDDASELYAGQIIQFVDRAGSPFWDAGTVSQVLENGMVLVKENGRRNQVQEIPVSQIQLAPDAIVQPRDVPKGPITRTWRDASGTHETKAELLDYADGKVKLKRTNGKIVTIPASKLSKADQKFLENYARQKAKENVPNPFE